MSIDATKSVTTVSGLLSRDIVNEQPKNQAVSVQEKSHANVSANVSLTQHSIDLLHVTDQDIDVKKVEEIKQAITSGTLVIDTHKIADKLIQQLLEHV